MGKGATKLPFLIAILAQVVLFVEPAFGWKNGEEFYQACTSTPRENPRGMVYPGNPGFENPETNLHSIPVQIGKIDKAKISEICETDSKCMQGLSDLQNRYHEFAAIHTAACAAGRNDVNLKCSAFHQKCDEDGHQMNLVAGQARLMKVRDAIIAYEEAARQAALGLGTRAKGRVEELMQRAKDAEKGRMIFQDGAWYKKLSGAGEVPVKDGPRGSKFTPEELKKLTEKTDRVLSSITKSAATSFAQRQQLHQEAQQIPDLPLARALTAALAADNNKYQAQTANSHIATELAALTQQIQTVSKNNIDKKTLGKESPISIATQATENPKFEIGKSIDNGQFDVTKFNGKRGSGSNFTAKSAAGSELGFGEITSGTSKSSEKNDSPLAKAAAEAKPLGKSSNSLFANAGSTILGAAEEQKNIDKNFSLKARLLAQLAARDGSGGSMNSNEAAAARKLDKEETIPDSHFGINFDKKDHTPVSSDRDLKPSFTLAGSDTDAEIHGLIGKMTEKDEQKIELASATELGDQNSSLFDRVHAQLRCQKSSCVVNPRGAF